MHALSRLNQVQVVTGEELEVAIAGRDTHLVVDFFATWCGPCVLLAQELEKVSEGCLTIPARQTYWYTLCIPCPCRVSKLVDTGDM